MIPQASDTAGRVPADPPQIESFIPPGGIRSWRRVSERSEGPGRSARTSGWRWAASCDSRSEPALQTRHCSTSRRRDGFSHWEEVPPHGLLGVLRRPAPHPTQSSSRPSSTFRQTSDPNRFDGAADFARNLPHSRPSCRNRWHAAPCALIPDRPATGLHRSGKPRYRGRAFAPITRRIGAFEAPLARILELSRGHAGVSAVGP